LSGTTHLRSTSDFRRVYACGKRYESHLMMAFVQPNGLKHHRFGITASRKAIGNAVERNRSKRLIRESFRLSKTALDGLRGKYDWVLNARRSLLSVKAETSLEEFKAIIARVAKNEQSDPLKEDG
jgi:ribonuclease P protein component